MTVGAITTPSMTLDRIELAAILGRCDFGIYFREAF